jgi:hypothetical protein
VNSEVRQALCERQLLAIQPDGTLKVDYVVGALLGTCAVPAFSLVVNQADVANGTSNWSVHYLANMAVEWRVLADRQHRLTAFPSAEQLVEHRLRLPCR